MATTWINADAYELYMGRWSRQVAPLFLQWLAQPGGRRWLDVGCGTGALSAAIMARCAPGAVTGVDPSEAFLRKAREQLGEGARLHCAAADALPLQTGSVDLTVSGLMLNFASDATAAVHEMARVTAPGGAVAAYVWDYAGRMDLIRSYWDAAGESGQMADNSDTGARAALCAPQALAGLFERCGLQHVQTQGLEIKMDFAHFDDYWRPFLGGQGPAPAHAMSLSAEARDALRDRLRQRLAPHGDRAFKLGARAWAVRATVDR